MDRNDRSKLMMTTRSFSDAVSKLCTRYSDFLSELQSNEQDKLDNIPEAFENSSLSDKLSEGIESIQQVNDSIEQILDIIADFPDTLNITMRKAAKQSSTHVVQSHKLNLTTQQEKKTKRIQIVITPSLNTALREVSSEKNISMNEIINMLLLANLQSVTEN